MKLYLSSMHPSNRDALLSLLDNRRGKSVLLIPNGWDTYSKKRFETELGHTVAAFRKLGLSTSQLDLKSADRESLRDALKDKTMVWLMAGNTFYLIFWLKKSGFSEVIEDEMKQGLVFGGESAGAAVAGPSLHGVEKVDDPGESPELIWEGLGLVDFGIIPHYGWARYRQPLEEAKIEMKKYTEVKTISNQQALVLVDGNSRVVDNPSEEAE